MIESTRQPSTDKFLHLHRPLGPKRPPPRHLNASQRHHIPINTTPPYPTLSRPKLPPACDAPKAKVRMATQTAKDVANVVVRGYATRKGAVPVGEDAADDLDAGGVEVGDGDVEAVLVRVREVLPVGAGGRRAVEVGAWCIVS